MAKGWLRKDANKGQLRIEQIRNSIDKGKSPMETHSKDDWPDLKSGTGSKGAKSSKKAVNIVGDGDLVPTLWPTVEISESNKGSRIVHGRSNSEIQLEKEGNTKFEESKKVDSQGLNKGVEAEEMQTDWQPVRRKHVAKGIAQHRDNPTIQSPNS
ncbi:hypothetical protein HAX54_009284 [Datura stramonium]|uniref:Uncharacterized protein n=1 Tax=Datura stramonium TaxID=4076 RepID=A0ABS8TEK5_DATST|nr:hypothetical protein [Datura stramonium]